MSRDIAHRGGFVDQFEDQDCVTCSIKFRVPAGFTANRRADKNSFYCPNGHPMSYTKSKADQLAEELSRERQRLAQRDDEIKRLQEARNAAERQLAASKGQVTKLKKRASAGVCPCCNRTFLSLQRHMTQKHPGFTAEPAGNIVQMRKAP